MNQRSPQVKKLSATYHCPEHGQPLAAPFAHFRASALRSGVHVNITVLLSIVVTLALVVMFALGLYWLNTKNRPRPVPPSPAAAAAGAASDFGAHPTDAARVGFAPGDTTNEWEANAHWHQHDIYAASGSDNDPHDTWSPFGKHTSSHARDVDDMRDELREALWDEQLDASASAAAAPHPDHAATASPSTPPSPSGSTLRCPQCRSSRIDVLNRARKAGSTIGSVAGATSGMTMALSGAETGAVVGSIGGPIGTVFGGLAGAVIAGLVGSAAGCAAGSAVGAAIDDNVLSNNLCLSCGHTFSPARP